ncbi:tRNA (32-2'-O)-methyltransferase regulator THADA-like [Saccostrea echinata]|uniref:tRNA (32-2'-O)-methyltransferase regulator THADA-like n=1 Tax=Saccostrea echinata TaxID=191078 RepID=UPI002A7EAE31|nr:tRNA (32-2'-O)-methyltransferase regulator THADA-like [Saccostrea echinata]
MVGQEEDDLRSLIEDTDWVQLFPKDQQEKIKLLFVRLLHYRTNDVHKLLRNLDEVHKGKILIKANTNDSCVKNFVAVIIRLYCHCIENIKLARSLEKFLLPFKLDNSKRIADELNQFFLGVIHEHHPRVEKLTAASCLLDQSDIIRATAEQNMEDVLSWILQEMNEARGSITTDGTNKENLLIISALVKIILQLFQSCPTTCFIAWKTGYQDNTWQILKQILLHLFQLLDTEILSADVKMLSGTASGIFLASAPTNNLSVGTFWTVFSNIFQGSRSHVSSYEELMAEGEIEEHSLLQLRLGAIAMVKGMLACASDICLAFHSKDSVPFCVELFSVVHEFCMGPISLRYHAFNLLQTWFNKFLHLVSSELIQSEDFIDSCLNKKTLDVVWLNWDSPVDDVSELAADSLKCLFEVWQVAHKEKKMEDDNDPHKFYSSILQKLKSVPWYIKGQYKVMSALVPYLGSQFIVSEYPDLPKELLQCLTTNYLASAAADVYRTIVTDLRRRTTEEELIAVWEETWWPTLLTGLKSRNLLQRNNVNQYWISSTTKTAPHLGSHIQNKLEKMLKNTTAERTWLLLAYLSVSKVIRATQVSTLQGEDLIREGLYSCQDEIRSEALGLLCICHKKSEPLSKTEDKLLREILPLNLKIDSAPFRQHLAAHLKRLLIRVRDGSVALIKSGNLGTLDVSLQFVEWLHTLCIDNLVPGSSYQRCKTCLEILSILYETFQYNENAKQRKSFTPESTKKLNNYVKERGLWDFFCYHSNGVLVMCLLDGADDIQELACSLLLEYYTWPLDGSPGPSGDGSEGTLECHLMMEALRLCNSPKPYQSQSGALLLKLIFKKSVTENGWCFIIQSDQCKRDLTSPTGDPVQVFLQHMLQEIQGMLAKSQNAPVKASKSSPIHGYVTAVTRCLTECLESLQQKSIESLTQHYLSLVELNTQIIQTMLNIMARGSESEGCPSFAEIGQALESLIVESEEDYSQSEALSGEHQYLLSWCWVNIKESCLSLGHLSGALISYFEIMALEVKVIRSVGDTFMKVLTQCRHRGVIEGCRTAFTVFCSALFESNNKELTCIPQNILFKSLDSLQSKAASTSTTRKSAGLPVVVQCIISCERQNKKNESMKIALDQLFNMAELPIEGVIDDRHDLPQVHALNILKCLYGDSSLHEALMQFIEKAVILVVEQFGSPAWSIRNAATRLFSVLITRLFGQKKIIGMQACNTKSLPELSAYYPELIPYLLQSLESALQREITAIHSLHPSLFPVLTILSHMGRLDQEDESNEVLPLRNLVRILLRSPVYFLRQLSSAAFVSLVPLKMTLKIIRELISEMSPSPDSNFIHGALVSIEMLTNSCNEIPEDVMQAILKMSSDVITLPDIVSAQYVRLLCGLLNKEKQTTRAEILETLRKFCSDTERKEQNMSKKPLTEKACIACLLQHGCQSICLKMLTTQKVNADVKLFLMEFFTAIAREDKTFEMSPDLLPDLLKCILAESYPPLESALISCMTEQYMRHRTISQSDLQLLKEAWQLNRSRVYNKGILASVALELGCVYLDASFRNENVVAEEDILVICDVMHHTSSSSDLCKVAVCHSLSIIGESVLRLCLQKKGETFMSSLLKLFFCVWNLVQDDDPDVRVHASKFIASLSQEFNEYGSLQCNTCLQEWISYFSGHFWWSTQAVKEIFQKLYQPTSVQQIYLKSHKGKQLYEAEDNSFFSEAIFNSVYLYQMLQKMLALSTTNDVTHSFTQEEIQVHNLIQDLRFVQEHLKILHTSVISDLCEPANFRTMVELLLKVQLLLEIKPDCLSADAISQLSVSYNNITMDKKTPVTLTRFLNNAFCFV